MECHNKIEGIPKHLETEECNVVNIDHIDTALDRQFIKPSHNLVPRVDSKL